MLRFVLFILFTLYSSYNLVYGYEYNKYVNKCESGIIHDNYQEAMDGYDSMFTYYQPHAVDLYNYSICALKVGKLDLAVQYTKLLARKGIDSVFFIQNQRIYEPIRKQLNWDSLLVKGQFIHDSIQNNAKPILDTLKKLVEIDQVFAKFRKKNYVHGFEPDTFMRSWAANTKRLIELFKAYKYLDENNLGVSMNDSGKFYFNGQYNIELLLTHQFQFTKYLDVTDSLKKLVLQYIAADRMRPNEWDDLWIMVGPHFKDPLSIGNMYVVKDNKLYGMDFSPRDLQAIETNRAYLGIFSVKEQLARLIFNRKENDFSVPYGDFSGMQTFILKDSVYFNQNYKFITDL